MKSHDVTIAVFDTHMAADEAVKSLSDAEFNIKNLSVVGQGYHTEEKVVGFYNMRDKVAFWGSRGAFWGGLWGLFVGGVFMTTPLVGPMIVLGFLGAQVVMALESAAVVGGLSALGAALTTLGTPKDSVIRYEEAIEADKFLVMAHGTPEEMARAKAILAIVRPAHVETYSASESVREALAKSIVHSV